MSNSAIVNAFEVSDSPFPSEVPFNSALWNIFNDGYEGYAAVSHFGWLDMVQLRSCVYHHHIKHIIVQGLDVLGLAGIVNGSINICNAYLCNTGRIIYEIPKSGFQNCKPMYDRSSFRIIGGWDFTVNEIDDLPINAKYFMRYLLMHSGAETVTYLDENISVSAYFCGYKKVEFITKKCS